MDCAGCTAHGDQRINVGDKSGGNPLTKYLLIYT